MCLSELKRSSSSLQVTAGLGKSREGDEEIVLIKEG